MPPCEYFTLFYIQCGVYTEFGIEPLIAYALLLPHIGFIISSLLLANGILLYFGTRKWWFYAIASANVIVAYFAFQAMSVTLP